MTKEELIGSLEVRLGAAQLEYDKLQEYLNSKDELQEYLNSRDLTSKNDDTQDYLIYQQSEIILSLIEVLKVRLINAKNKH